MTANKCSLGAWRLESWGHSSTFGEQETVQNPLRFQSLAAVAATAATAFRAQTRPFLSLWPL